MKKESRKFSILFLFTILSYAVFILGEIVSVSIIIYSANKHTIKLFRFGEILLCIWVMNPIPLVLSIIGASKSRSYRWYYIAVIFFFAIVWLIGGAMIAPYF